MSYVQDRHFQVGELITGAFAEPGEIRRELLLYFMIFVGMAVVIFIPVWLGMNLFAIPGIIFAAKWIMSPIFLVGEKGGIFAAMSESWQASSGNTLQISLAFVVLFLIWAVVFGLVVSLLGVGQSAAFGFSLAGIAFHSLPILLMGLAIAAYRQLSHEGDRVAQVFA